jgi:hypothetical protein
VALKVVGRASGQTKLIAQAENGLTGSSLITVPAVAEITVSAPSLTMDIGDQYVIWAHVFSADHRDLYNRVVTWDIWDDWVTISPTSGYATTVTAQHAGSHQFRAFCEGSERWITITVKAPPAPPPPPPPTCSGASAGPGVTNFGVAFVSYDGCGGSVTYRANSYAEAKQCAKNAGYTLVSTLCTFSVHVEDDPLYETSVVAPTESDAINCVRVHVCGNCPNLRIIGNDGCLNF